MADKRCGTVAGYHAHRRRGEATCQSCRDAMTAYSLPRQAARRALVRDALAAYKNAKVSISGHSSRGTQKSPTTPDDGASD